MNFDKIKKPFNRDNIERFSRFVVSVAIAGLLMLGTFDYIYPPSTGSLENVSVMVTVVNDQEGNPIRTETNRVSEVDYDYIEGNFITVPFKHIFWMWDYYSGINSALETPEQDFRPPWSWVTPFGSSGILNHPKYLVTVVSFGEQQDFLINWRSQTPIFIWYMTIPIVLLSLSSYYKKESKFIFSWIVGNFMPWLISDLGKQNVTFNHYFQFTIPAICIGIPYFWKSIRPDNWKKYALVHLILTAIFFFAFYPVGVTRTF